MRKKVNVKLIVVLIIICLIAIAGIILFFTTDIFRTKRSAFFRYFNQIPDALKVVETTEFDRYNQKKDVSPYERKADITIQNSSNIANSNILDKVNFKIDEKRDAKKEKTSIDFSILNGNQTISNINMIRNKNTFGIYNEDVSNAYITVNNENLKRIASDFGIENTTIFPNEIRNIGINKILETSKIEKNHILECVNIIKNRVPQTAYSKEGKQKVIIKDKGYGAQAYKLTLSEEENAQLQILLLEKISKDSILMDYLTSKFKYFNMSDEYTSINDLNNVITNKIQELKKSSKGVGKLEITVYEYKQKNIKTEIVSGNNKIVIEHLKKDNNEISTFSINDNKIEVNHIDGKYILAYENTSEVNKKRIQIEYSQEGNVKENNIRNNMTILYTSGIKTITYLYNDSVEFKDEITDIKDFNDKEKLLLNDYQDDEIKEFAKSLKRKINEVYINKGASIGINLDPLFIL